MFFPLLSVISCEEGKALADSWNAAFMESSAKENQVMMMMMMTPATPRLIYSLANSVLTSSIAMGAILAQNVPRQLQSSLNLNWKSNLKEHLVPTWPGRINASFNRIVAISLLYHEACWIHWSMLLCWWYQNSVCIKYSSRHLECLDFLLSTLAITINLSLWFTLDCSICKHRADKTPICTALLLWYDISSLWLPFSCVSQTAVEVFKRTILEAEKMEGGAPQGRTSCSLM